VVEVTPADVSHLHPGRLVDLDLPVSMRVWPIRGLRRHQRHRRGGDDGYDADESKELREPMTSTGELRTCRGRHFKHSPVHVFAADATERGQAAIRAMAVPPESWRIWLDFAVLQSFNGESMAKLHTVR
jgi:hypothetical protein